MLVCVLDGGLWGVLECGGGVRAGELTVAAVVDLWNG